MTAHFIIREKARNISDRLNYAKGKADATNNLGVIFDMKGDLQFALRYYNEAYNRYKHIHDAPNVVQTTMNIAMVYEELGKDQKAFDGFRNAISLGRKLKQDSIMGLLWYNYLLEYPDRVEKDSMPVYINNARRIAIKYNDQRLLLGIDQLNAEYYIQNKQRNKGLLLLQQAADKAVKNGLNYLSMDMFIELGDLCSTTDSVKAVAYYQQGLQIAISRNYGVYVEKLSKKLYSFYTAKKDIPKAFYYSQKLINLHDEQLKTDNVSGIDYIEYAIKDQQLEAVSVRSKYEMRLLVLAAIVCFLTILIIIVLWRNWKRLHKTSTALRFQFQQSETTMEALDVMNKNYARLIKIVAHDLRNPISAISSITTMLQPDETLQAETKELIDLIETSSRNCLELINELLETNFDEHQNLKLEKINPDELLEQSVQLLSFRAKDKNQVLLLSSDVDVMIDADYEKLWRVINNLIVNAMKFSDEGSEVLIEGNITDGKLLITVKDDGVGIPLELQNKIFDPFTSAKRTGTSGEQPFGLGLYISRQIIEAHHGRIWVESQPGKGATFFVELPLTNSGN